MQTVWKGRITQAAARYGEVAPTATTCCNACRTCVQTSLLMAGLAGLAAAGSFIARHLPRRLLEKGNGRNAEIRRKDARP